MDESIADLIREAQRGETAAFAELIHRYERSALAIAYAISGNGDRAGNAVQEALLRAWRALGTLKDPERFGPWLAGIVRNAAINQCRRVRRAAAGERAGRGPRNRRAATRRMNPTAARFATAWRPHCKRWTKRCGTIVALRYYEGASSRQIGDLLDLSPGAVDMRLTRARQELRQILAPIYLADAEESLEGGANGSDRR